MNKRQRKKQKLSHLLFVQQTRIGLLERESSICQSELADCKRRISALEKAKSLQDEVIEKLSDDLAESKRQVAALEAILERNAQATNSRLDFLEKKVADKVSKKSWFGRG